PVGYSTEDKTILLLDDNGKEVAPGQVGEIVVQSEYLALGYWRNAELTETVFRRGETPGAARRYFTGDLGRMDEDGCLTCLGRKNARVRRRSDRSGNGDRASRAGERSRGHGAPEQRRLRLPGRLRGPAHPAGPEQPGAASGAGGEAAGLHDSHDLRDSRRAAADHFRQNRPPGTAGAGARLPRFEPPGD